jgi:hypothetical protein
MADGAFPKLLARRVTLARKRLELVIVGARSASLSRTHPIERAASEGYSIFRRNPAADSLQVQRRAIDDSIHGWRKPRSGAASKAIWHRGPLSFLRPLVQPASARR